MVEASGLGANIEGRARVFLDIIDVRCEREKTKISSKVLGLATGKMKLPSSEMGRQKLEQ